MEEEAWRTVGEIILMTMYEYTVVEFGQPFSVIKMDAALNDWGAQGWRLKQIVSDSARFLLIFERELVINVLPDHLDELRKERRLS